MRLRPAEFYDMDNEDFFLAMRGFKEMIIDGKRDLRRLAYIFASTQVKDMPSAMRMWPIEGDDELNSEIRRQKALSDEEHNNNFSRLVSMFKKP